MVVIFILTQCAVYCPYCIMEGLSHQVIRDRDFQRAMETVLLVST